MRTHVRKVPDHPASRLSLMDKNQPVRNWFFLYIGDDKSASFLLRVSGGCCTVRPVQQCLVPRIEYVQVYTSWQDAFEPFHAHDPRVRDLDLGQLPTLHTDNSIVPNTTRDYLETTP